VKRRIGWLKECRRPAARCEKLAEPFLSIVRVAMIRPGPRLLNPSDKT
jgi:hypothetical protein